MVEDFNQFFGFFRVFAAQDFGGIVFEMAGVAVQDDVFNRKQVVGVHGEATQAHAEQQSGEDGIAGHFAADGYAFFHAVGGADDVLQRFEDGRVAGLVEVADAVVAAVDRQEVLNQVVGADGNEVDELEDAADGHGGGRDFDHAADADRAEGFAAFGQLALGRVQMDKALAHFGNGRNHRPHHAHGAVGGGAEDGAHLGAEHDRLGEAQANAGQAECGVEAAVGRAVLAEPARIFIDAQIDGADGDVFTFEFFDDAGIDFVLFVFGRHVVTVEVEEFATEQADAVCAEVVQGFDVFGGIRGRGGGIR